MKIAQMIQEGGFVMYLIILFGMPTLIVCGLHTALRKRATFIAGSVLVLFLLALGAAGTTWGRSLTERAVETFPAEHKEAIRKQGYAEAARNIQFGGLVAGIAAIPLAIGELRRKRI